MSDIDKLVKKFQDLETSSQLHRIYFVGVVHPERATVQLILPPTLTWFSGGQIVRLKFSVAHSQVLAEIDSNEANWDIRFIRGVVHSTIQDQLDVLGFSLGCSYRLEIIQAFTGNSPPVVFGVDHDGLQDVLQKQGLNFGDLIALLNSNGTNSLRRACRDATQAIIDYRDTGFHLYRAIEAIKNYFWDEGKCGTEGAAWQLLRETLSVERTEIDGVQNSARLIRHGREAPPFNITERSEMLLMTWTIIAKFASHLKQTMPSFSSTGTEAIKFLN